MTIGTAIAIAVTPIIDLQPPGGAVVADSLLLETGGTDYILLETGGTDTILIE